MGFGGLSIATSGIRAAQRNLAVTGHNIANSEIPGFSRQRIVQTTAFHRTVGMNPAGDRLVSGMGTDWGAVQQIRNEFLDVSYRQNVGRLQFYSAKVQVGLVIESLLGEMHGAYNFQSVLNDMWFAIQELSAHPDGIETRNLLLATASSFLTKSREVYDGLVEYQLNLDQQIREIVIEINTIVADINELNNRIRFEEAAGDKANDFRDDRNRLLDRLATLVPIDVFWGPEGDAQIFSQGHQLLSSGHQNLLGLRFISNESTFVEPVFTTYAGILSAGTPPSEFTSFTNYRRPINNANNNDFGRLNALLMARGTAPAHVLSADLQRPENFLESLRVAEGTLAAAQTALTAAQEALDADPGNADLTAARDAALEARNNAQAALDAVMARIAQDLHSTMARFLDARAALATTIEESNAPLQEALDNIAATTLTADAFIVLMNNLNTASAGLSTAQAALAALLQGQTFADALEAAEEARDEAQLAYAADPDNDALREAYEAAQARVTALNTAQGNVINAQGLLTSAENAITAAGVEDYYDGLVEIYRQAQAAVGEARAALAAAELAVQRNYEADVHNFNAHMWSIAHGKIPRVQMNLDRIVNHVVTMLNDALTGNLRNADGLIFYETDADGDPILDGDGNRVPIRPTDLNGNAGVPLFIRALDSDAPEWPLTDPPQNPDSFITVFSINNIQINEAFLGSGGHNHLALSVSGAPGDNRLMLEMQRVWLSNSGPYAIQIGDRFFNVQDAYIRFTGDIATEISEANSYVSSQTIQVIQAENLRNAVKGVSMDEELNAMLRFQFAFQSASRVFNVIDSMIDTIVNGTGRVGR